MKAFTTTTIFAILFAVSAQAQTGNQLSDSVENTILADLTQPKEQDTIPQQTFQIDTIGIFQIPFIDSLICYAESFLGTPYQYGSKGPNAFDCSGFTGFIFSSFNIKLAQSSTYQYKDAPIKFEEIDNAKQGDLIFFMGRNGRKSVGHVGIVVDIDTVKHSCRFIHAATHGGVIETYFPSSAYYNQRFMGFGRYDLPSFTTFYQTRKTLIEAKKE